MKRGIKIVKQIYSTPDGEGISYGIIFNGKPRCEFHSKRELDIFLDAINGKY